MIKFILIAIFLFMGMLIMDYIVRPRHKKKNQSKESEKHTQKTPISGSVLGESRFDRCQSMPNDATLKENDENIENNSKEGNNFEPSNSEQEENYDPEPMDIDVPPLERIEPEEEENIEEEVLELFGEDAVIASGLSVEEMLQTNRTIENTDSTLKEEENAGRVLYQNKKTDMFEQMVSGNPVRLERIRGLMYLHEKKHGITEGQNETSTSGQNGDLKDFDISSYVR